MQDDDEPLERVQAANLTARVPDGVAAGVFATAAVVLQSPTEVLIDFVQGLANPRRIATRVVMPGSVAVQFADALATNLAAYATTFGGPPQEPTPAPAADAEALPREAPDRPAGQPADGETAGSARQPIADAYDHLKASDEVLGGAYANTVAIRHTGSEFHFDFIHRCFPRSIVNARVYMSAPRVPALLDSLRRSLRMG